MSEKALPPIPPALAPVPAPSSSSNNVGVLDDGETSSSDTQRVMSGAGNGADLSSLPAVEGPASPRQTSGGGLLLPQDVSTEKDLPARVTSERPHDTAAAGSLDTAPPTFERRRPLAFHRSLTSPYPNRRLGALRHPSYQLASQDLTSVPEADPNQPLMRAQQQHLGERRSSEPDGVPQRDTKEVQRGLQNQRISSHDGEKSGHPSFEIASPDWSNSPHGSASSRNAKLVTHRLDNSFTLDNERDANVKGIDESQSPLMAAQGSRKGPIAQTQNSPSRTRNADPRLLPSRSSSQSLLADVLQLPISTLLQLIPPHLLDPTHERLSASSLQIPVTSVQALLESCRTLNWLFGHLDNDTMQNNTSHTLRSERRGEHPDSKFDISELVQRVCDVVSGQAAEKSIDIVLLQDVGPVEGDSHSGQSLGQKFMLMGDEGALRFIVLKALAQIIAVAAPGSAIETHLEVTSRASESAILWSKLDVVLLRPENEDQGSRSMSLTGLQQAELATVAPLVQAMGGTTEFKTLSMGLATEMSTDSDVARAQVHYQICLPFRQAAATSSSSHVITDEIEARQRFLPTLRLAEEPDWDLLSHFVRSTLSGSRIALHGKPSRPFVRHLISFFASCNCDLAILSTEDRNFSNSAVWAATPTLEKGKVVKDRQMTTRTAVALDGDRPSLVSFPSGFGMGNEVLRDAKDISDSSSPSALLDPVTGVPVAIGSLSTVPVSDSTAFTPFTFLMIDDDLEVLQQELLRIRAAISTLRSALPACKHSAHSNPSHAPATHAIVFFYSLLNFRPVRDAIQGIIESAEQSNAPLPGIMMVPKPCGSRRLLTALHTAWEKPLVDPFFSPTATTPMYPTAKGLLKDPETATPPSQIPATSPPRADEFDTSMKREDRMSKMRIDIPPPPAFVKKAERQNAENKEGNDKSYEDDAAKEAAGIIAKDPTNGLVAQSLLSIQKELASPPKSDEIISRPSALDKRKTLSRKKSQGLLTPHSSHNASSQATSSPMMTDALEYFSETVAKISDEGASGFMIQSPDGRPAGIFFQPRTKTTGPGSRTSNASRRTAHTQRSSGDASHDTLRLRHASEGAVGDRVNAPLPSLKEIVENGKSAAAEAAYVATQRSTTLGQVDTNITDAEVTSGLLDERKLSAASSSKAQITALSLDASAPQGQMYSPQIGIQSVLPADIPSAQGKSSLGPGRDRITAALHEETGTPKEKNEPGDKTAVLRDGVDHKDGEGLQDPPATPVVAERGATQNHHGLGNLQAAQPSFSPAAPTTRPSAQPQAGVLIGAGFQPTKKKIGVNMKKAAKDIEVLPPIKVLIVDDNPINVKILSTWLEKRKIKIGVARDGREAVREWQTGGYQLILMDIQLPVMDGIEATKVIRRLEREASIVSSSSPSVASAAAEPTKELGAATPPVSADAERSDATSSGDASSQSNMLSSTLRSSVIIVALTASVLNSDRVAALAAGCNDFLNKPVNMRWLERKVTEWGSMQYLIGFRSRNSLDEGISRGTSARNRPGGGRPHSRDGSLLHPLDASSGADGFYSNDMGMVKRAFGQSPGKLAQEVADRLYIGDVSRKQKVR